MHFDFEFMLDIYYIVINLGNIAMEGGFITLFLCKIYQIQYCLFGNLLQHRPFSP